MPHYRFQRQVIMSYEALQELEVEAETEAEAFELLDPDDDDWEEVHDYGAVLDDICSKPKLVDTYE